VSNGASDRINTNREKKLFLVFLKMSVTRHGRPDRHNKVKENIFQLLDFSFFFVIFDSFQIFCFVFFRKKIIMIKLKKDKSGKTNMRMHK